MMGLVVPWGRGQAGLTVTAPYLWASISPNPAGISGYTHSSPRVTEQCSLDTLLRPSPRVRAQDTIPGLGNLSPDSSLF